MDLHFDNVFKAAVTVVSNEFIDRYMAEANGEYVKEYLYLCRHDGEAVTVGAIADALNHTEADVKRALNYWKKAGVLKAAAGAPASESGVGAAGMSAAGSEAGAAGTSAAGAAGAGTSASGSGAVGASASDAAGASGGRGESRQAERQAADRNLAENEMSAAMTVDKPAGEVKRPRCPAKEIARLSGDAEFTQLIYIAQKYMNKTFTPKECEVFAYLYGTLQMSAELLEYLVEYCAQNDHTSIRYIEKVALDWHARKILTVEAAESYSRSFTKDSFAVMKAFGLTGRNPGDKEFEDIRRWFKEYGFTRELVVEACNRTMEAIHTPSFQYAEQILKDWKSAGVRTMGDVAVMDKNRQTARAQTAKSQTERRSTAGKAANRFHNLEEHGYDYDKMVWNMINPGQGGE